MNIFIHTKTNKPHQSGFSLVEILVGLAISSILMTGIVEIYIGNKKSYLVQDALTQVQENGRAAIDLLTEDVRMTGFQGCSNLKSVEPLIQASGVPAFTSGSVIAGHTFDGSSWEPTLPAIRLTTAHAVKANTDVLTVTRASSCSQELKTSVTAGASSVTLIGSRTCPIKAGDYFLISDCGGSEIFKSSSVTSGSNQTTLAMTGGSLTRNYSHENTGLSGIARVMRLTSTDYFISDNTTGIPILRRNELDGNSGYTNTPLLEGIEDMSILYGSRTPGTTENVLYQSASAVTNWEYVSSVRISLLMRSIANNLSTEPTGYTFAGATTAAADMDAGDKYLRRVYTTSVQLRERI